MNPETLKVSFAIIFQMRRMITGSLIFNVFSLKEIIEKNNRMAFQTAIF